MAVATLSIDLLARLASLEAGFDKATRLAEKTASLMETRFKKSGGLIGKDLTQIFAGVSVAALTRNLLGGIDALNDFSEATGASVENASALDDIARRTGSSLETVEGILIKFNGALNEADGKNGVSQALQRIGLNAKELRALDPAEALRRTAVALSEVSEDGDRARLTQELFGKGVRDAASFLKDLAEQQQLVGKITKEQTDEVKKFNEQLLALQANVVDSARVMAGPLVSSLNSLFDKFKQFDSLKGFVKADLGLDDLSQLKNRAGQLDSDIKRSTDTVERLAEALSRDPGNELLGGRLEKARTRLDGLRREASQTSEQLKVLANRMAPPDPFEVNFPGPDKPRLGPRTDKPEKAKKDKAEFVGPEVPQSLKDALERLERTDVTKVARLRDELERLLSIRSAGGATPEVAEAIESVEAELLKLDPATKAASDRLERLNQLLGATPSAQLEATRQEMLLLAEALARNEISAEQFTEAAATRLELLPDQLRTAKTLTEELGLTFSSAFEDAIVGGGELRDVLKGLAQDIARIATRKLITEPLGNAFTSFLGGLFGGTARTGMAFDEGGVRRFRLGGVTNRPTYFRNGGRVGLMSEEGQAEAVMPLVRGKGGKLGVQASGQGGGTVVYQTNHYSGGVSRAELASFTAANNRRLIEGLQQSRNRDGDFA